MVFYFTATGNSLYAAKQLEKAPVSIAQAVHDLENVYEAGRSASSAQYMVMRFRLW